MRSRTWSAAPSMAYVRAYHGVAAVQNASGYGRWELFAVGGSRRSDPTKSVDVLASCEVFGAVLEEDDEEA